MKNILLFGSDYMAEEYLKVLKFLECQVLVVGRNAEKAQRLASKYGYFGYGGGVACLEDINLSGIGLVIVATSVDSLAGVTLACLQKGLKHILVEKPGALNLLELLALQQQAGSLARVRIAYNRRYYNSVRKLKDLIQKDDGPIAGFFDFTDREKDILQSPKDPKVLARWGLANSSHVIDAAFFLLGQPEKIECIRQGHWDRHPSGNVFVGHGNTKACPFSYFSVWSGGGRWNIEVATLKGRYKLSPLEELVFCKKDQFGWEKIELDDQDDQQFKPGLLKMVKQALFEPENLALPDIHEQVEHCKVINRIFGYEN